MKSLNVLIVFLAILLFSTNSVFAVNIPNFPACSNPQGTLVVSYNSGVHGVVGGQSYTGSDRVYQIGDGNLIQCLCTTDGQGIQTNWWKISSLDEFQINTLKKDGWIYIPNGSVWGLENSEYLAKNTSYSCTSGGGGGSSSSTSVNTSVGQVLGLAFTGNIRMIYLVFSLGILSLIYGQILHRARD